MGHDILIYAVVVADQNHKDMLELEMEWEQNKKRKISIDYKKMPEELQEYRCNQGCYSDYSRLSLRGKRIYLTSERAYNNQSIDFLYLPPGTIGIDVVASY